MAEDGSSKIIVDTPEDFEFVTNLLQQNLGGKIDQALVDQLKAILESNVIIDHASEQEQLSLKQQQNDQIQQEIDEIKREFSKKENEINARIVEVARELLAVACQQDDLPIVNCPVQLDAPAPIAHFGDKLASPIGNEAISQLNDLMRLC